jgi:predicted hydrocarbon binding protein
MTTPAFQPAHHCVGIGRRALQQLRMSLERDAAPHVASTLQEVGFAGGEELYHALTAWCRAEYGVERPAELDTRYLGEALSRFFAGLGWGQLAVRRLGGAVLALDSTEWAEALEEGGSEYPSCHLTCGMLADLFGRIADGLAAVMEVECRSRSDVRCRFLVGAPETLGTLYERMATGLSYVEALGLGDGA